MKKILLLSGIFGAAFSVNAQVQMTPVQKGSAPYELLPDQFELLPTYISADKSENQSFYVDYSALNTDDAYVPTGTGYYNYFEINSAAPAIDSLFTNVGVALKPYIGFTDYADLATSYYEPDLGATGSKIRVDSVFAYFTHVNHSGNTNNIHISLRKGVSYNFGGDEVEGPTNTIYWADTIVTATSLSPNGLANGDFQAGDGQLTESAFLYEAAAGVILSQTASSTGFVIDTRTTGLGVGDSVNVAVFFKADGASTVEPYVWNTTAVRSSTPTQIGLFYASAAMWAKVTYTNTMSLESLDNLGFTIHNLMPNPAKESTVISYELKNPANVDFIITDMTGRQVSKVRLGNKNVGTQQYTLNTSDMASGYYNVSMLVDGKVFTQKLNVVK